MDYKTTANKILDEVGGKTNVSALTHCATRLRFTLNDNKKADIDNIKNIEGVIDVVLSSGQYQVIIGTDVGSVFKELAILGAVSSNSDAASSGKMKWSDRLFDTISGIFTPIIPALTAAGMLKAVLVLLNAFKWLTPESQTYQILNFVSDTAFYFLPVFVAISTAQKLKSNMFVAGLIGASLIHPTFISLVSEGAPLELFGISVPLISYASSVIPSILAIVFMSYVERFAETVSPKAIRFLLKPLLTILIVVPVTLLLFGPLGSYIGNILAGFANYLNDTVPWLVSTLMGAFFPLLVLTGMHWSFVPVIVQSYATYNYEGIMGPGSFVSNICQGAASLAVAFKTKNTNLRQVASSAGITALLGVTEPAMFGVTLKVKKALYCVMAGGAIGGLYAGVQGVVRYTSGTPGLASFAIFIGENPMNLIHALISVAIGFAVTFALVWFFVDPDGESEAANDESAKRFKAVSSQTIKSPLSGNVVDIKQVNDPTFANEIVGRGVAILPEEGIVYAPFDGNVVMVFKTGHAMGLVNNEGIEVLIHVGLDTVKLEGKGFKVLVKEGDTIKQGQKLLEFDIPLIENAGYDIVTPILVTNLETEHELVITDRVHVQESDDLLAVL